MKRILIVDDSLEVGRFLRSALLTLSQPLEIVLLPSAEEGLLEAGRFTFDLLIADIRLPGISGFDLVERIRLKSPAIKVIMISALGDERVAERVRAAQVDSFFHKPLEVVAFLATVQNLLSPEDSQPPMQPVEPAPHAATSPLPADSMGSVVASLRTHLNALAVTLLDDMGRVVLQSGSFPQPDLEEQWIPAILSSLSANARLSRMLGSTLAENILTSRGAQFDLLLAPVGNFALIIAMRGGRTVLRLALAFEEALKAQKDLINILNQMGVKVLPGQTVAYKVEEPLPVPQAEEAPSEPPPMDEDLQELAALLGEPSARPDSDIAEEFWSAPENTSGALLDHPDVLTYDQARQLGLAPGENGQLP